MNPSLQHFNTIRKNLLRGFSYIEILKTLTISNKNLTFTMVTKMGSLQNEFWYFGFGERDVLTGNLKKEINEFDGIYDLIYPIRPTFNDKLKIRLFKNRLYQSLKQIRE